MSAEGDEPGTRQTPTHIPNLPSPGDWIAERFQIIRNIGRGGFGMVYEARQKSMGHRRIALKVLAPKRAHEPRAAERFRQEALLASRLRHPNTITMFDFGATEEGLFYIAMEYLEGQPLSEVLRRGPIPPERADKITRQILGSLSEAHALGMIHRDLKPDNIFLCHIFGETDLVKVLDFGLAKFEGELEPQSSHSAQWLTQRTDLTMEGLVCGTPDYMAPEQARGITPLTPACDVYAMGLLIYYMLTGSKPFVARAPIDVLKKQVHDPLPPLPHHLTHTLLAQVMETAARKPPLERYPDAQHMLLALQGHPPETPSNTYQDLTPRTPTEDPHSRRSITIQARPNPENSPTAQNLTSITDQLPNAGNWETTTQTTPALSSPSIQDASLPLIGRNEELAQLLGSIRKTFDEGHGHIVLLKGSTGIGKTHLLQETARITRETSDALILTGSFDAPGAGRAEALGHLVGELFSLHSASPSRNHASLEETVQEHLQHQGIHLTRPNLQLLSAILAPGARASGPDTSTHVLARLARIFLHIARNRPLLLVLDNLHQADNTSIELLQRLCSILLRDTRPEALEHGLCLIIAMRSEALAQRPELLQLVQSLERAEKTRSSQIHLPALNDLQAQKLVHTLLPSSPSLRHQVAEAAHNNPMHILRILKQPSFGDRLFQDPESQHWHIKNPETPLALPRDLREMLRLRISDAIARSSAPEAMQELLYRLAVLGHSIPRDLLNTLLNQEVRPWPEQVISRLLRELLHLNLLHEDTNQTFLFDESILPEVLLHEIEHSPTGPGLHRNAAAAKRSYYQSNANPDELAEHLLRAGDPREALPLLLNAAHQHQRNGDHPSALARNLKAERLLSELNDPTLAPYLHATWLSIGELHLKQGHYGPAEAQLLKLAHALDPLPEEGDALLLKASCKLRLGELRFTQKLFGSARQALERALQLSETAHLQEIALESRILLGELHLAQHGPYGGEARQHLETLLEEQGSTAPLLKARGLRHLGGMELVGGDALAAERYMARARLITDEVGDPGIRGLVLSDLGLALLLQGRTAEGEGILREARVIYSELSDRVSLSVCLYRLGLAAWQRQEIDEALRSLEQALFIQQDLALDGYAAETLELLGRVHEVLGEHSNALRAYQEAQNLPVHHKPEFDAELKMRQGIVHLKTHRYSEARIFLEAASQAFAAAHQLTRQVQCLNLLGMLASSRHEHTQALAMWKQSTHLAQHCDDAPGHIFALVALALLTWIQPVPGEASPTQRLLDAKTLQGQAPEIAPSTLLHVAEHIVQGNDLPSEIDELPPLQRNWLRGLLRT